MEQGAVTTIGMFDGVHKGHCYIIKKTVEIAQSKGLKSVVCTFDRHPLEIISPDHAPQLLTDTTTRVRLIYALGVDRVVVLSFDSNLRKLTARQFIKDILIDQLDTRILVIGHDHSFGSDRLKGIEAYRNICNSLGIEAVDVDCWGNEKICSSAIRNYMASGDIDSANRLLGYRYALTGKVVHGRHLGHTIGFPTANIKTDRLQAIPSRGVYAADITFDNDPTFHRAMVNIGVAPTVSDNGRMVIEAHILDFNNNIYDKTVTLHFIKRLRDEKHFDSLDDLAAQLADDEYQTRLVY